METVSCPLASLRGSGLPKQRSLSSLAARGFHVLTLPPIPPLQPVSTLPWFKILFLIAMLAMIGTCTALALTDDDSPSTYRPPTRSTSPPSTRTSSTYSPTATSRPFATRSAKSTPTAINEDEHQLWLAWPDHYEDLADLIENMEANYNTVIADGILDANDLIIICPEISGWEQRLNSIAKFMSEYRATDPNTIEENTPLQKMETAIELAHEHLANSKALCN